VAVIALGGCSGGTAPAGSTSSPATGVAATAATSAEAGEASSGVAAGGDCVTGGTVTEINGKPARVFCGPATAVVTVGGADLAFKDGACEFLADTLTVNLGTTIPGELTGPDYFGLTAFGIDTLPLTEMPAITWIKDGAPGYLGGGEIPELEISDDQSTIEFSGTVPGEGAASGVINC
jgi:hypothetical protein